MTNYSELQGEITALCCFVGCLGIHPAPAFSDEALACVRAIGQSVRDQLSDETLRGFAQATISLSSKRG